MFQQNQMEDDLARELYRRKQETQAKQNQYQRICNESEEIKGLKQKLQQAYVNKERTVQMKEKNHRQLIDVYAEAQLEDAILKKNQKEIEIANKESEKKHDERLLSKDVLKKQMREKLEKIAEAQQQYQREKELVDQVVNKIIKEDIQSQENEKLKKKQNYQAMIEALDMKAANLEKEKQLEQEEIRKYLDYLKHKDNQQMQLQEKKDEENKAKEIIFLKLKAEQERKTEQQKLLEELRNELQREEYELNQQRKEEELAIKKKKDKEDMMKWEKQAREFKEEQRIQELALEKEFKNKMQAQFKEDERVEQYTLQKRKLKEMEYKQEIEKQWQLKLQIFREEKQKELDTINQQKKDEEYKQMIIQEEKERLLKEHAANLQGFLPKGIVDNNFGKTQPSKFGYKNQSQIKF